MLDTYSYESVSVFYLSVIIGTSVANRILEFISALTLTIALDAIYKAFCLVPLDLDVCKRRGGLKVSSHVSESSGAGSNPVRGHCFYATWYSHSASLHPGV